MVSRHITTHTARNLEHIAQIGTRGVTLPVIVSCRLLIGQNSYAPHGPESIHQGFERVSRIERRGLKRMECGCLPGTEAFQSESMKRPILGCQHTGPRRQLTTGPRLQSYLTIENEEGNEALELTTAAGGGAHICTGCPLGWSIRRTARVIDDARIMHDPSRI